MSVAADLPTPTAASPARTRHRDRRRSILVGWVLAVATFLVCCVSVSVGDFPVQLLDVVPAALGLGDPGLTFIVRDLRLPRVLGGVLVGAAFGISGAVFQSLARNPLASPDIIGITAGASAAAVLLIVVTSATATTIAVGAFAGATLTAAAVYLLAWRSGLSPYRLVLVGIGLGALLTAVTAYLLTRSDIYDARRAMVWLTGSLNATTWQQLRPVALGLVVLVPVVLVLAEHLRLMQLGDDTATGLGVPVERARLGLVAAAVGLAGLATAAAGPIAFVAFVSAPIARRLVRQPLTIVPAALTGSLLVVTADLAGRRLFSPTELPVGVLTGLIGAPYLLWLLARANRIGAGG